MTETTILLIVVTVAVLCFTLRIAAINFEKDMLRIRKTRYFFKRNYVEIMAILDVLVCLDLMLDKLTDEEKICAKQAQLHLQGALDFQETKWIVEAGNFAKAAATRLNNEVAAKLISKEENHETEIPPNLRV